MSFAAKCYDNRFRAIRSMKVWIHIYTYLANAIFGDTYTTNVPTSNALELRARLHNERKAFQTLSWQHYDLSVTFLEVLCAISTDCLLSNSLGKQLGVCLYSEIYIKQWPVVPTGYRNSNRFTLHCGVCPKADTGLLQRLAVQGGLHQPYYSLRKNIKKRLSTRQ